MSIECFNMVFAGAIEVTIANMAKAERCSTDQIYVVGFVPSYQLPKSRSCSLDPFLHPLISDIEDIFIDGMNPSCNIPSDKPLMAHPVSIITFIYQYSVQVVIYHNYTFI